MKKNLFFNPSSLYREFMILDLIEKNKLITQREISDFVGVSVSNINNYLRKYEKNKLIYLKYYSSKTVNYFLTEEGINRKKLLNINYLKSSLDIFKSASENIISFLNLVIRKGFKNIYLYGAGEVAEILLQTLKSKKNIMLNILGIIDDDLEKHNKLLFDSLIHPFSKIYNTNFDGILISSYSHQKKIFKKLLENNIDSNIILTFFNELEDNNE